MLGLGHVQQNPDVEKVEQLIKLATLVRAKERASLSQVLSTFDTNLNVATCWGIFWKINRLSNYLGK